MYARLLTLHCGVLRYGTLRYTMVRCVTLRYCACGTQSLRARAAHAPPLDQLRTRAYY